MKNIDFTDFFNVFLSGATILALFFLVCSLVTAVRTYRQGIAKNSAYLKVLAVLTPIMIAAIILFGLLYL